MAAPAVVFDGVWKKFRRGERHDSLRDLVPALIKSALRRGPRTDTLDAQEFWAVQDVSFEVLPGEALGIIGPNGAGKSTTLKLLTRILKPNRGTCRVAGRVGALIEIAAGFHPDLTGRENVYLQGSIMGMNRAEISKKFDAIVDFSGTAAFIDTQIKRYSSGMNARLGFAIAAHLDPDVLIIDEVLSVGDMSFQRKCVERMLEFKKSGAAIVFVSHNLPAVIQLCDNVLFLASSVQQYGDPRAVLRKYVDSSRAVAGLSAEKDAVVLQSATLTSEHGTPVGTTVPTGVPMSLRISMLPKHDYRDLTFGFLIYRASDNLVVYDMNFEAEKIGIDRLQRDVAVTLDISFFANLTRGDYYLEVHAYHNPTQTFLMRRPAGAFAVDEMNTYAGIANVFAMCKPVEESAACAV